MSLTPTGTTSPPGLCGNCSAGWRRGSSWPGCTCDRRVTFMFVGQLSDQVSRYTLTADVTVPDDRSFWCLGPATYDRHEGERPMAITWRLSHPLPGDLFARFAAAVA